jgi:tRNA threonylcarbamoyladenosine modification (KEOPS) complex Cgi121 subunit
LQNKDATTVEFPDKTIERRTALAQIFNAHKTQCTFINTQLVISLMHLNIAVSRALVNRRDVNMKTNSFGSEIVYFCSPTHSINSAIDSYGMKNCQNAFFAIFVGMDDTQVAQLK